MSFARHLLPNIFYQIPLRLFPTILPFGSSGRTADAIAHDSFEQPLRFGKRWAVKDSDVRQIRLEAFALPAIYDLQPIGQDRLNASLTSRSGTNSFMAWPVDFRSVLVGVWTAVTAICLLVNP